MSQPHNNDDISDLDHEISFPGIDNIGSVTFTYRRNQINNITDLRTGIINIDDTNISDTDIDELNFV